MRDETIAIYRIRNESRWIKRAVERVLLLARAAVILDDGSTDNTEEICRSILGGATEKVTACGWIRKNGESEIHFVRSPYADAALPLNRVQEIRDKNLIWQYAVSCFEFSWALWFDGDEWPSNRMVRELPEVIKNFNKHESRIITLPIVYLWNSENIRRVDALYSTMRPSRIFNVEMINPKSLTFTGFDPRGKYGGGFHCSSVPTFGWEQYVGARPNRAFVDLPFVHAGYIDEDMRQAKYKFYNEVDPNNDKEGQYLHIIGLPDLHCRGPVQLEPWEDS